MLLRRSLPIVAAALLFGGLAAACGPSTSLATPSPTGTASGATGTPTGSPGGGSTVAAVSGVRGLTVVDGRCVVIKVDSPCPDTPFSAKITIDRRGTTDQVTSVVSASDGRFTVEVAPGDYTLYPTNLTGAILPRAAPVDVTVREGSFTELTVRFDSGMR